MARYTTTVHSTLKPDEAFAYMADFSNSRFWDPSVQSAEQITDGPVALGTRFLLVVKFRSSTMPLDYVIAAHELAKRLVLVAQTDRVKSTDEITFVAAGTGTDVTYDADLRTLGWFRLAAPIVALAFKGLGDNAKAGLQRELNQ